MLFGYLDDPNIILDFVATKPVNDSAKTAMMELRDAFITTMNTYRLCVGDLTVVDNRIAVNDRYFICSSL